LNEYCRGALEALSWVKWVCQSIRSEMTEEESEDFDRNPFYRKYRTVLSMIEDAREDILNGSAIDFAARLKAIAVRP